MQSNYISVVVVILEEVEVRMQAHLQLRIQGITSQKEGSRRA
jgi:hypothetical protein